METEQIQVGTKIVYTGDMANVSGIGCVYQVNKKTTSPAQPGVNTKLYSFDFGNGGLVAIDTSVSYDIVLNDGRIFKGVYGSNISPDRESCKGNRFYLGISAAETAQEVAAMLANAAVVDAANKARAAEIVALFEKAKLAAKDQGEKLGLMTEADFNKAGKKGTAAAYNLRLELKGAKLPVASLTGDYNSIRIKMKPDTTAEQFAAVKKIAAKYEAGSFDGMTDCYDYDPTPWGKVFGDVRYVFVTSTEGYCK